MAVIKPQAKQGRSQKRNFNLAVSQPKSFKPNSCLHSAEIPVPTMNNANLSSGHADPYLPPHRRVGLNLRSNLTPRSATFIHPTRRILLPHNRPDDQEKRSIYVKIPSFVKNTDPPTQHLNLLIYVQDYRYFSPQRMLAMLQKIWKTRHGMEMIDHLHNFYVIHFHCHHELEAVYSGGPYAAEGALVTVDHWIPDTNLASLRTPFISLWFRLYGVPLDGISQETGTYLGSLIGEVEKVDVESSSRSLGYLRVNVWIHPDQPILAGFYLHDYDGSVQWIEAKPERVYRVCRACGIIGHNLWHCPTPPQRARAVIDHRLHQMALEHGAGILSEPELSLFGASVLNIPLSPAYRPCPITIVPLQSFPYSPPPAVLNPLANLEISSEETEMLDFLDEAEDIIVPEQYDAFIAAWEDDWDNNQPQIHNDFHIDEFPPAEEDIHDDEDGEEQNPIGPNEEEAPLGPNENTGFIGPLMPGPDFSVLIDPNYYPTHEEFALLWAQWTTFLAQFGLVPPETMLWEDLIHSTGPTQPQVHQSSPSSPPRQAQSLASSQAHFAAGVLVDLNLPPSDDGYILEVNTEHSCRVPVAANAQESPVSRPVLPPFRIREPQPQRSNPIPAVDPLEKGKGKLIDEKPVDSSDSDDEFRDGMRKKRAWLHPREISRKPSSAKVSPKRMKSGPGEPSVHIPQLNSDPGHAYNEEEGKQVREEVSLKRSLEDREEETLAHGSPTKSQKFSFDQYVPRSFVRTPEEALASQQRAAFGAMRLQWSIFELMYEHAQIAYYESEDFAKATELVENRNVNRSPPPQ